MKLWIRAEASAEIGFGHVMRCVALGEVAVETNIDVCFVGDYDGVAQAVLHRRGFETLLQPDRLPALVDSNDAVVFDGYHFSADDHRLLPRSVRRAAIDDRTAGDYDVDLLVNPNLPTSTGYVLPDEAALLVGPRYAMVRREFAIRRRRRADGRRLLVTLGGSDVSNVGPTIAAWAAEHSRFDVTLLLGPAAPDGPIPSDVHVVRAPHDVGAVFDAADVAVSSAGSTTWELCSMGIPTILAQVADNQRDIGEPVAQRGAAVFLGRAPIDRDRLIGALESLCDPGTRTSMSTSALQLVDGRGARRVLRGLLPHLADLQHDARSSGDQQH